ncbi:inter-alpha-trypsin inhibitor heavy chain H3 isoform X4 [Manis pentadactyla]|uniref:inter-alpha-trypsin inhibitor heavy chain H3 isoform X4 n=1 Tax=Manis pentadactyla TaxID=143292 RepID=UPI00255C39AE|nr:inter-alpha-trypsin inhibitor heavy chain H3 isoform X4 [Manis pentadactyla]
MASAQWPCLLLVLSSGLVASGFQKSPSRSLGKRSLPDGVVRGIEVYSTKISCKVTSRFAHNVVTTRAVNRADTAKEVSFDVELPKTAFITNFTLTIDGVTYPGNVKEKEVAKKQYEKAVSQGKTAGLVKASGRKLEKFTVSVNVAAGSKVTFELTYEELLKRHKGKYEMFLKVQPKQLVKHFEIEADIFEPQGISSLDAEASFITNDLLGSALTKSFSGKKGHVSFKPSLDQQRSCPTCTDSLLNGDFTITYDVNRESPANVQIVNGYFVHFFAPQGLPVVPKNVVFVIDVSGSMYGRKMEQTKDALLRILEDVNEEDHLNFILFSGQVTTWKDSLVRATPENTQEARAFVKSIKDQGMTNINDGLLRGISMLNKAREEHRVPERSTSIVIMLTDGDANVGESRPEKIQENVRNAIGGKFPLYNLGFGNNLNYNFLESMALENHGLARRIYEDSDANLQLQGFYDEVANPLLTGVEVEYPENAILDLTQNAYQHLYDGSEIVVAGRLVDQDVNSFKADVKGHGAINDLTFTEEVDMNEMEKARREQDYIFGNYIERLWAYLTIEQLLEKRKKARGEEKENLTAQALDLSLKYHFVTPLTSMVVTKPEDSEDQTAIADKPGEGPVDAVTPSSAYLSEYLPAAAAPHPTCSEAWPQSALESVLNWLLRQTAGWGPEEMGWEAEMGGAWAKLWGESWCPSRPARRAEASLRPQPATSPLRHPTTTWTGTPTSSSKSQRKTMPSASTSMKPRARCCASFRTLSQITSWRGLFRGTCSPSLPGAVVWR